MAFQQGLSGLNVSSKAIEATSHNIANSATVGFKSGQAHFADIFAASLTGATGSQIGIGATMSSVFQQFTQGNITSTNNPLDLAINGQGFYRLDDGGTPSYSRNGQFHVDKDGFIVNDQALKLTGYPANGNGVVVPSTPAPIQLSASDLAPNVTTAVGVNLNLDSRATILPAVPAFDPTDPTTFNSSTALTVYDTQGNALTYTMYFRKVANNAWDVHTIDPGTGAEAKLPGTGPALGGNVRTGVLSQFDYSTDSISFTVNGAPVTLNANYTNLAGVAAAVQAQIGANFTVNAAAGAISITDNTSAVAPTLAGYNGNVDGNATTVANVITLGTSSTPGTVPSLTFSPAGAMTSPIGNFTQTVTNPLSNGASLPNFSLSFSGSTQFGNTFSINQLTQDGFTTGRLAGLSVGQDGTIQGRYTNGQTRSLAQLVLANFTNPNGLAQLGNNQWAETINSGPALVGAPNSGRLGVIQSASVEESNVDLTAELVNLITQQRNYQANAQSIKTEDQILSTLVNLR